MHPQKLKRKAMGELKMLKKADVKLLVFDLDDTLLNDQIAISLRSQQAIRAAVEQGIKVTLATGRMYCSTVFFADLLDVNVPLITYNGAMVNERPSGKPLFHSPIKPPLAKEILQLCKERQWYIQSYCNDELYVSEMNDYAKRYAEITGAKPIPAGKQLYTMEQSPTKMLVVAGPNQVSEIVEEFQTRFGDQVSIAESKPSYLEITNPDVNKGNALKVLAERIAIDLREVVTFGNGVNDISMLRCAGMSVAVGNAHQDVKEAACLVTGTNNEDGVAAVIERYLLS